MIKRPSKAREAISYRDVITVRGSCIDDATRAQLFLKFQHFEIASGVTGNEPYDFHLSRAKRRFTLQMASGIFQWWISSETKFTCVVLSFIIERISRAVNCLVSGAMIIWRRETYTGTVYDLYYNYEKYPLSPLKPKILALIEQYLPNISDPVYLVHQSFMWFLWLNWRKSTFYPITAPNDSKCWPIVTLSLQEPAASNCDVTMTDCSRVVAMDAFLTQWCWG